MTEIPPFNNSESNCWGFWADFDHNPARSSNILAVLVVNTFCLKRQFLGVDETPYSDNSICTWLNIFYLFEFPNQAVTMNISNTKHPK